MSLSAVVAGFVAVLIGFTSSVAIVFQAATALGATHAEITSWMWALGLGMGLCSLVPSVILRKPVMVAWSTPGAAVLATAGAAFDMPQAVGAFLVCGALVFAIGASGWFERAMSRIPMPLAAALLAGVLTRFGLDAFSAAHTQFPLVFAMLLAYLIGRRLWPRYTVVGVLVVGIAVAAAFGQIHWAGVEWGLAHPVWTTPSFTLGALVSLAVPLFVVTMASQNLPGLAVIRASDYAAPGEMPVSRIVAMTGGAMLVLGPFGAFALNLSAITAAICMGREAHPDPTRRWIASAACGLFYCIVGLFGAAVTGVLTAFPKELVAAIAGLALLGTIGGALATAMGEPRYRESALITFLVTLSGLSLGGIGAAFWGVVAGALALFVQQWRSNQGTSQ
jgi:benzoate membrane transport protein